MFIEDSPAAGEQSLSLPSSHPFIRRAFTEHLLHSLHSARHGTKQGSSYLQLYSGCSFSQDPRNAGWVWGAELLLFCCSIPWPLKHQESQQTVSASTLWKSLPNITPIYLWKAREETNGNWVEKWSRRGFGEWARSLLETNEVISNISQWKDGAVVGILLLCIFAFVLNQMSSFKVAEKII